MTTLLRNPLTRVWALLTAVTLLSWWIGRGHGAEYRLDAAVTVGVLLIAALKVQLVMRHFMEVRTAPRWLRRAAYGWTVTLLVLLLTAYCLAA